MRQRRGRVPRAAIALATFAVLVSSWLPAQASTRFTGSSQIRHGALTSVNFGVGVTRCTFVDRTRSVPNFDTTPPSTISPSRTLVTEIRYPTVNGVASTTEINNAAPAMNPGGFPMVVFAHGYDVTPDTYALLLDAWTRKGFVVVAPIFPDESPAGVARQYKDTEHDLYNEPADLTFVTRQVLADNATLTSSCPLVYGLIRASELALAGHSDGGIAVGLLALSTGRDPQGVPYARLRAGLDYRADLIFSASTDGPAPYSSSSTRPPLLVVQSALDQCNAPGESVELYRTAQQNDKWFLELLSAHHLPPFDGEDLAAFDVVSRVTSTFLQYSVAKTGTVATLGAMGNARPLVARMFHAGLGPAIPEYVKPPKCGFH